MPDLYSALHPHAVIPPNVPTEYPKWVVDRKGARALVHSAMEESSVTGVHVEPQRADACETVNALFSPHPAQPEEHEIGEKSLLQLEASALGIEVDRRWGVKKLRREIEARR